MRVAIYPGTFDPITNGHLDVIRRALKIFDKLIVLVAYHLDKSPTFEVEERVELIREALRGMEGVEVDRYKGLLVKYAREKKATALIRGLRAVSDFEYEFQMAQINRELHPALETVFLVPAENYTYLSSSLAKEIFSLGGDISQFVPEVVEKRLREKLKMQKQK